MGFFHEAPMNYYCNQSVNNQFGIEQIGGKAIGLQKLSSIPNICVPKWFIIPTQFMKDFLKENHLLDDLLKIKKELKRDEVNLSKLERMLEDFKAKIYEGNLSSDLLNFVFVELEKKQLDIGRGVAVRSSAPIEDSTIFSCAGLYESVIVCSEDWERFFNAIKEVWASTFQLKAVLAQKESLSSALNFDMAIIVQELVHAKVSGVITSLVMENNFPGFQIAANYGLGMTVVNGSVSCDTWVLDKDQGLILEQNLGAKKCFYSLGDENELKLSDQTEFLKDQLCLSKVQLRQLFLAAKFIKDLYQNEIDVEFAFSESGALHILQARNLVVKKNQWLNVIDAKAIENAVLLAKGKYSLAGVSKGRLVYVSDWKQLSSGAIELEKNDIVLAHVTTNTWTHYLNHIGGLITCEGAPMSHPMLLCREMGVVCVIGFDEKQFSEMMKFQGREVTLDGYGKQVFLGNLEVCKTTETQFLSVFDPIIETKYDPVSQGISAMKQNKMVLQSAGDYWRKTPTYSIRGFQAEINLKRFDWLPHLIRKGPVHVDARYIEGFVCTRLCPFEEYVGMFSGYTLDEAFDFLSRQKKCYEDFLQASEAFDATLNSWQSYIDLYAQFRAYIWAGSALQAYASAQAESIAARFKVPKYYFEESLKSIQNNIEEIDVQMRQDVQDFARKILDLPLYESYQDFKKNHPEDSNGVELLDSKYRFEHSISLNSSSDLQLVYDRIKIEVKRLLENPVISFTEKGSDSKKFLLGFENLDRWQEVFVMSRIYQCNAHHIDKRSKSIMRPKLIHFCGEGVFDFSIQQIKDRCASGFE